MISASLKEISEVKKVALFYGHAASNKGDLAINSGLASILAREFPNALFYICFLDVKNKTYLEAAQESFGAVAGRCRFIQIQKSFVGASIDVQCAVRWLRTWIPHDPDIVLVNSGEFFFSYTGFSNFESLFWRFLPCLAAGGLQIPVAIPPSSFGPFEDGVSIALLRAVSNAFGLNARELSSERYLNRLDIRARLFRDPAFECPILNALPIEQRGQDRFVGLIPRLEYWGIRQEQRLAKEVHRKHKSAGFRSSVAFCVYRDIIEALLASPASVRVILLAQTLADRDLCAAIASAFREDGRVYMEYPVTYSEFLSSVSSCSHIITSRFHSAIFGLSLGKDVYGVHFPQHGNKLVGLFDSFQLGNRVFTIDSVSDSPQIDVSSFFEGNGPEVPRCGPGAFCIGEGSLLASNSSLDRLALCLEAVWRIAKFQLNGGDMRILSSFVSDYFFLPLSRRSNRAWPFNNDLRSVLYAIEPISDEVLSNANRIARRVV